jgi:hypothetical protein
MASNRWTCEWSQRRLSSTPGDRGRTTSLLQRAGWIGPEARCAEALQDWTIQTDVQATLLEAIEDLPSGAQAAVRASYLRRLDYTQAAETLGVTLSALNPAAAEVLCPCRFLDPDMIPEEMIAAGGAPLGPMLAPVALAQCPPARAGRGSISVEILAQIRADGGYRRS